MTNPTEEDVSPLGPLASIYRNKDIKNGILDQPQLGLLEFYPAGYTKSSRTGATRQSTYQMLYEIAVIHHKEAQLYPFGKAGHLVRMVLEPENRFDPNAIRLELVWEEAVYDLGYVPARIAAELKNNLSRFPQGGRIYKVKNGVHGKYYSAKVVFGYGDEMFSSLDKISANRFSAIVGA